jgi:hypothetical protein
MIKEITTELASSFINYLHLYSWFEIQTHKLVTGRKFRFKSVEKFWELILNEELKPGDIVQIDEGFLTDWIPKIAGQAWKSLPKTSSSVIDLNKIRQGHHFASDGIVDNNHLRPLGVVRLPYGTSNKNFAVLSITTFDCWSVDLAIPVLVSKEVYYSFVKSRHHNQSVEADIEAVLQFGNYPVFNNSFMALFNSSLNPDFINQITSPLSLPRIYLRLTSPLNSRFKTHNSHPKGTIWTFLKTEDSELRIHNMDNGQTVVKEVEPYSFFSFIQAHMDISNIKHVEYYSKAFQEGKMLPEELFPELQFSRSATQKTTALTEFDGLKRHFSNSVPIEKEPLRNQTNKAKILAIFKGLQNTDIRPPAPESRNF